MMADESATAQREGKNVKKIVLIGDSIRLGYDVLVKDAYRGIVSRIPLVYAEGSFLPFPGTILGVGLELLALLDHGDDLVIAAGALAQAHLDDALALLHHAACVDEGAHLLVDCQGLAGEGGLAREQVLQHRHRQRFVSVFASFTL